MRLRTLALFAMFGLLAAGCTIDGGGWLIGDDGGKATVGFDIDCEDTATATLAYLDKKNVNEGGAVNVKSASVTSCDVEPAGDALEGFVEGTYRPQPKGATGSYYAYFRDTGVIGPSKGDSFSITLTGGKHDGYDHIGTLEGGNAVIEGSFDPCTVIPCP